MGNKCFKGSVSDFGGASDDDAFVGLPKLAVTSRPDSDYSRKVDPQRALNEYHQILHEMQSENLVVMREQLKKKPELFVLNNLIMSIQFFEHFDK